MSQVSTLPKLGSIYAISAQQQAEYQKNGHTSWLMPKPVGLLIDSPLNPLI